MKWAYRSGSGEMPKESYCFEKLLRINYKNNDFDGKYSCHGFFETSILCKNFCHSWITMWNFGGRECKILSIFSSKPPRTFKMFFHAFEVLNQIKLKIRNFHVLLERLSPWFQPGHNSLTKNFWRYYKNFNHIG